jgi:hypothetical protein
MPESIDAETEVREIRLKIENLRVAVSYHNLPQQVKMIYLKELQTLMQRLHELGVES